MASGSIPGDSTVPEFGPVLPAATIATTPRRTAISIAADSGSVTYELDGGGGAPNDRFMTRMLYWVRWPRTHSTPRTTDEMRPPPSSVSTRTSAILAAGAMLTYSPAVLWPLLAMMPAIWVPYPPGSLLASGYGSAKLAEATMRPFRSASFATPESSTATVMPAP